MAEIQSVGDFNLVEASLITSNGKTFNLSSSIINITFFEDILQSAITGQILIQDPVGLSSVGPIIGQEYLKLKIETPTLTDKSEIIDFTENVLIVNSLESRKDISDKIQAYILHFTTSELAKNQRTKISRSLKGSYSEIVKKMLNEVECKKKIYVEPTSGNKRIVAPNIRPFDIISIAARESISNFFANRNYLFFETFRSYNFRSLSSLYAQNPVQTYTSYIKGTGVLPGGAVDIERELGQIIDFEIVDANNTLVNYTTGVYASNLIVHDIFSKTYKKYQYGIFDEFKDENHITHYHKSNKQDFPIYSHVPVEENKKTLQDFPARTFVTSTSNILDKDASHSTENNIFSFSAPNTQDWLQRRASQKIQLEQGLILNILVHGNTVISAGDVVKLDIPYTSTAKTTKNEADDRFYKGIFLIKTLRHDFDFTDAKHTTHLTLVKDSLEETLDGPEDAFEPKPKKSAEVYEKLEDFYPNI
jgi:hypothetical protein